MPDYIDQLERNNTYLDIHDTGLRNSLGTASTKDSTNVVVSNSTDLVESGAVKDAIDNAITSAYKASGSKSCSELISSLLIADNEGNVYNITDSGETTSDFIEGSGKPINAGNDVAIIEVSENTYKFNIMGGFIDLSNYVEKETGKGLSTNDFTNEDKALIGQTLGNNTVLTTDKTPFLTRQTLNPTGFSGYVREKLVGTSYAWNQLCENGDFSNGTQGWTLNSFSGSVSSNICTLTLTATGDNYADRVCYQGIAGHKYLVVAKVKPSSSNKGSFALRTYYNGTGNYADYVFQNNNTWQFGMIIIAETTGGLNNRIRIRDGSYNQVAPVVGDNANVTCCMVIDLTLAFGSTIADYLNNLSNNGGITKLRDMGCPIDKYTAYGNYLVSSKTSGKKIVGKNLVDSSVFSQGVLNNGSITESANWITTDFIPTFGEANITIYSYQDGTKQARCVRFSEYDASFNFIKNTANIWNKAGNFISVRTLDEKTRYIRSSHGFENIACTPAEYFATNRLMLIYGNSTIESYESYSSTTYSLGNDELRGLFKLVNNEIVADGDVKESNGSITRKYLEPINLGSLTWVYRTTGSFFDANLPTTMKGNGVIRSAKYVNITPSSTNTDDKIIGTVSTGATICVRDSAYGTDASAFTTAMDGVYAICEIATPTTEQSTPFADPMSLVGATTEEYIDTRDIPCPVGAERQYMGQSEDVVEIPSSPMADGKRVLISEVSGGKEQVYWDIPTLYYKEYTVQGDGTKTYGDLLAELKPYYEALSEDEKTYSKVMMRATSSGNECLTFVGNYWYSRMGVNASGLWLDQIDFQYNKYFKQVGGDSITDYTNTNAGTNVFALRVLTYTRAES